MKLSQFPDPLEFREAGHRNGSMLLQLTHSYRFFSSLGTVRVPKGFVTDGASIPRVFWNILSPFGDYFGAAVIHDFLYSKFNKDFSRDEADAIFLEGMTASGVPFLRRTTIYTAVRLFGWTCFRGDPSFCA